MISFFYQLHMGSGICRGLQVSERMGARQNPESNYEDGICVWVKCIPEKITKRSYSDIVDGAGLIPILHNKPIKWIAYSEYQWHYLSLKLARNDIILIPHHHCNFENVIREEREVKTVGYVGLSKNLKAFPKDLKDRLKKVGLEFKTLIHPHCRKQVCEFLKGIDIQLTCRVIKKKTGYDNVLKLTNGGAFKIPSIAFDSDVNKMSFKGGYASVKSIDDVIPVCKKLKEEKSFYEDLSEISHEMSLPYHIDKILPLYKQL